MKFFIALLLTALLSFIAGLKTPWWSLAIVAFLVGLLIHQKAGRAFLSGFLGLFLLWAGLAWWSDNSNHSLLSGKIGEIIGIGNNPFLLILITGVVAGLVGGFAAMSGSFLRSRKRTV